MRVELIETPRPTSCSQVDHVLTEHARPTEYTEVENIHLDDCINGSSDSPPPVITLIHQDGSVTKRRGLVSNVAGELGQVKTVTKEGVRETTVTRHFKNCLGIWFSTTKQHNLQSTPTRELHILCWDSTEQTPRHCTLIEPEYANFKLPTGETRTVGETPTYDWAHEAELSETMTVTASTNTGEFTSSEVVRIQPTEWDIRADEFIIETGSESITVESVDDITGTRPLVEVESTGPVTTTRTRFGYISMEKTTTQSPVHRLIKENRKGIKDTISVVASTRPTKPTIKQYEATPKGLVEQH